MRYCIKTQKDFMTSGTLHVKGIEWKVLRINGKTAYTHRSITISWYGCYQTKNHLGQLIFSHEQPSVCLEDASLRILEAYSERFVPSWGEEEIPITWEEAA